MNIVHAPEDMGSYAYFILFYRGPIIQYCCNFNYEPTAHTHTDIG